MQIKCPKCGEMLNLDDKKETIPGTDSALNEPLPAAPPYPKNYSEINQIFGEHGYPKMGRVYLDKYLQNFWKYEGKSKESFGVHEKLRDRFQWVVNQISARRLGECIKSYDGCLADRLKRNGSSRSMHAWAIAIDINAGENPMGKTPKMDMQIVEIFEKAGFTWGGRWKRPDGMHFQWGNL